MYIRGMMITRGKVHKYLSMTLDLCNPGELRATMVDDLKGVMEDFPEVITGRSTSLSANCLFQVSPEDERALLDNEQATPFHYMVPHMLFVTPRSKKDIKISIYFLCTRVSIP